MEKIDKQERWVDGIKIDMSQENSEQWYEEAVRKAREKNKTYGYGGDETDEEARQYRINRLNIKKKKELKKRWKNQ